MKESLLKLFVIICYIRMNSAQLSSIEEQRNTTSCNVNSLTIDCGTSVIAVDSIVLKYDVSCDTTCCGYISSHCSDNLDASERSYVRRECSGKFSCTLDLSGNRDFCALGLNQPSYVTVYYFCIPSYRKVSVCGSSTIQSTGSPLYLTNNNYPGVTTGDSTCSCSLEVYECSSNVYLYMIDADLYSDTSTCEQSIEFKDNLNSKLHEIKCEDYYGSDITTVTLNKHYITINFLDNSVQNLEGLFFLGFSASSVNSQISLSCSTQSESRCVDCSSTIDIPNGNATLAVENDSSNGASASVVCDDGYNTTKEIIVCTDSGTWETSECTEEKQNGDSTEADGENPGASEEKDGGLTTEEIIGIVVGVVAVLCVIAGIFAIYCMKYKQSQNNRVSSSESGESDIKEQPKPETIPSHQSPNKTELSQRLKLPPITPKDEIKHGPVYIDHDEAHIFALTIHIPFRKPANRLEPMTNTGRQ